MGADVLEVQPTYKDQDGSEKEREQIKLPVSGLPLKSPPRVATAMKS